MVLTENSQYRYMRYKYCINEEKIDVKEGFIFIERNIVPMERLHKIDMMQGPIDRMFKLAKVKVTTAGGDVTLRFLEEEKAEFIVDSLKSKINEIVKKQKEEVAVNGGE